MQILTQRLPRSTPRRSLAFTRPGGGQVSEGGAFEMAVPMHRQTSTPGPSTTSFRTSRKCQQAEDHEGG
jgi:hypothetical protein